MKKLSLFLMALVAVTTINAKVVTFDFTSTDFLTSVGVKVPANDQDATNLTTINYEGVTLTFTKVAKTDNRIWNSSGALDLRMYTNSYVTISAPENITGIEVVGSTVSFGELTKGAWTGDTASVTLTATATCKVSSMSITYGEQAVIWEPDTIGVSEALQLVKTGSTLKDKSHYIKGVVSEIPYLKGSYYCTNLTDISNATDTIEAFNFMKDASTTFKKIEEMQAQFGLGDTVLVYANAIAPFGNGYELNGGYYVKTLGKANIINATNIFPFAYGAIVGEADEVEKKYHFDIVLTSEDGNPDKGIHMGIVSSHENGIAGSYTLYPDNSFINGATTTDTSRISGSVKISYIEEGEVYNKYKVVANYSLNDQIYRIDSIYELPAITEEEWYNLDDDMPFVPSEGDTITCEQALSYAKSLGTATSPIKVYIRGWVVSNPKTSDSNMSQRNFYINDDSKASSGIAQSYYCYEQGLDSIAKGNEVLLYGNILLYGDVAEIKNGQIYRLTGTEQHYRDIQCVDMPGSYISVERAYEIGMALDAPAGQTVETAEEYTVVGYIAKVSYQTKNDTATWFMSDDKEATFGDLQAYKCRINALIAHGDKVMLTGKIAKYVKDDGSKTTIEFRYVDATFVCESTDLVPVEALKQSGVRRMIMNNRFYILHGHNLYNAQGLIVGHE